MNKTEFDRLSLEHDDPTMIVTAKVEPLTDGEDCIYCGKDSWTCEHAEAAERDNDGGSLGDQESEAERNA